MSIFSPQTILAILGIISLVTTAIIIIFSQIKSNDLKVLRDSNKDLRDSINDKSKEIDELIIKVELLEKKVAVLEAKNNDLSILVKEALVMYFTRNPKVAEKMQEDEK